MSSAHELAEQLSIAAIHLENGDALAADAAVARALAACPPEFLEPASMSAELEAQLIDLQRRCMSLAGALKQKLAASLLSAGHSRRAIDGYAISPIL